jgi:cytochrome c oxidase subunit II
LRAAADDLLPQLPVLGAPIPNGIALQTKVTALGVK